MLRRVVGSPPEATTPDRGPTASSDAGSSGIAGHVSASPPKQGTGIPDDPSYMSPWASAASVFKRWPGLEGQALLKRINETYLVRK
eukprot:13258199-Alexandrium_andersonii.AAC.1